MARICRESLRSQPEHFRAAVVLPTGHPTEWRLLRAEDAEALGRYFVGLSPATRQVYAPHPFDVETAARLCAEIDALNCPRFVAQLRNVEPVTLVAYFIVRFTPGPGEVRRYAEAGICLDPDATGYLAPSVADDFQSQGVGSALMTPLLDWLRQVGCRRLVLWGGVRAANARAQRFYTKAGFRLVGDFLTEGGVNNHDMFLDLT